MLKPKFSLSKPNFLAVNTRIEVHTLNWMTAFFIFAACVVLLSDHLSVFVRQYSFQIFLGAAVLWMLIKTEWRPLLRLDGKVALYILILGGSYFGGLLLLDQLVRLYGVEGRPGPIEWRDDLILLAVIAPIAEELFFRDLLLRSLYHRIPNRFWAAIISSAIFMVAHLTIYPGAFFLGLVNSIFVFTSRSLIPGIVFHSLSNMSLLFLPAWYPALWAALHELNLLTQFYR